MILYARSFPPCSIITKMGSYWERMVVRPLDGIFYNAPQTISGQFESSDTGHLVCDWVCLICPINVQLGSCWESVMAGSLGGSFQNASQINSRLLGPWSIIPLKQCMMIYNKLCVQMVNETVTGQWRV